MSAAIAHTATDGARREEPLGVREALAVEPRDLGAPSELMKSANAYGRPMSAAQIALCGEEPSSHSSGASGSPGSAASRFSGWSAREAVLEVGDQLGELVEEVVGHRLPAVALEHLRGHRVGAGRAPDAEVDPARDTGR